MIGHLGSRVSALLDGQLAPAEEERAWEHVQACHTCRDLVEREGWVKTRLQGLSLASTSTPARLKGALGDPSSCALRAHPAQPGRRLGMVALGGGAVGAACLGVLALVVAPGPSGSDRPRPVTSITGGATGGSSPAVVPGRLVGPLRGTAGVPGVKMVP